VVLALAALAVLLFAVRDPRRTRAAAGLAREP